MSPPSDEAGDDDQRHQPETHIFRVARFVVILLRVLVIVVVMVVTELLVAVLRLLRNRCFFELTTHLSTQVTYHVLSLKNWHQFAAERTANSAAYANLSFENDRCHRVMFG